MHPDQGLRRPRRRLARRLRLSPLLRHGQHRRVRPVGHARVRFGSARRRTTMPFNNYGKINKQQYNAQDLSADRQQRRLRLDRRPLQPEPQQLLRLAAAAHRPDAERDQLAPRIVGPNSAATASRRNRDERFYDINYPVHGRHAAGRRRRRRRPAPTNDVGQLRHRVRPPLQPVEHRQHPRQVALHAGRRRRPDGRPELPVCEGQRRRHRHRPAKACATSTRPAARLDRRRPAANYCRTAPTNTCVAGYFGGTPYLRPSTSTATATRSTRSPCWRRARPTPTATA